MIILRCAQFSSRESEKSLGAVNLMASGLRKKLHIENPDLSESEIEGIVKKEYRGVLESNIENNANSDTTPGLVVSGKRKGAISDKRIDRARQLRQSSLD